MSDIQRWGWDGGTSAHDFTSGGAGMKPAADGRYVLHADHESALSTLRERVEKLENERDEAKAIVDWVLAKCDAFPEQAYPVGRSPERPLIQQIQCAMHQVFHQASVRKTYERIAQEQQDKAKAAELALSTLRSSFAERAERAAIEIAENHREVWIATPNDRLVKGHSECSCGEAVANGEQLYKDIVAEHLKPIILAEFEKKQP